MYWIHATRRPIEVWETGSIDQPPPEEGDWIPLPNLVAEHDTLRTKVQDLQKELQEFEADTSCEDRCEALEAELTASRAEVQRLTSWKRDSLDIMAGFQIQEIGQAIDAKLGTDIGPQVLPWILAKKAEVQRLGDELAARDAAEVTIPRWEDVDAKYDRGEPLNPLERFVYDHEPAIDDVNGDRSDEVFRKQLSACLAFVSRPAPAHGVVPELTMDEGEEVIRSLPAGLPAWEDGNWPLLFRKVVERINARHAPAQSAAMAPEISADTLAMLMEWHPEDALGEVAVNYLESASAINEWFRKHLSRPAPAQDAGLVTVPREEWAVTKTLAQAWVDHAPKYGGCKRLLDQWNALRAAPPTNERRR